MRRPLIPAEHPWVSDDGIKRLRQLQRDLRHAPRRYNQNAYCRPRSIQADFDPQTDVPVCKTVACLAGHLVFQNPAVVSRLRVDLEDGAWGFSFKDSDRIHANWTGEACKWIGATEWFARSQNLTAPRCLFGTAGDWPEPFGNAYHTAPNAAARAKVACRRIDHFLATGL